MSRFFGLCVRIAGFLKIAMSITRGRPSLHKPMRRRRVSKRARTRLKWIQLSKRRLSTAHVNLARLPFFVNERHYASFACARRDRKPSGWWYNEHAPIPVSMEPRSEDRAAWPEVQLG